MIGVSLSPCLSAEAADRQALVGKVESVTGPTSGYEIHRAGVTKSVEIYSPIFAGDRIVVLNQEGVIRIVLSNGQHLTVDRRRSPYRVSKISGAPTPLSNPRRRSRASLDHTLEQIAIPCRPSTFECAPNQNRQSRCLPIARLASPPDQGGSPLAWRGGESPHAVRVFRVDGQRSVLKVFGLKGRQLPPRNLKLPAGRYRVEVEDADFRRAAAELEAVEKNLLPKPPAAANLSRLSPAVRTTVEATWLAGRDKRGLGIRSLSEGRRCCRRPPTSANSARRSGARLGFPLCGKRPAVSSCRQKWPFPT